MQKVSFPKEFGVPLKLLVELDWQPVEKGQLVKQWFQAKRNYVAGVVHSVSNDDEKRLQLGLSDDEESLGGMSAALLLGQSIPDEVFYAVLPLVIGEETTDLFWIIGIDHGEIILGTDVVGELHDAHRIIDETSVLMSLDDIAIYAPGSEPVFGVPQSIPPSEFFNSAHFIGTPRLKPVGYTKQIVMIVMFVLACIAGFSVNNYLEKQEALKIVIQPKKPGTPKRSSEELKIEAIKLEEKMLDKLLEQPSVPETINQAITSFSNLPFNTRGWRINSFEIDFTKTGVNTSILILLSRESGNVEEISKLFKSKGYNIQFSPDASKVAVAKEIDVSDVSSPDAKSLINVGNNKRLELIDFTINEGIRGNFSTPQKVARPTKLPSHLIAPDEFFIIPVTKYTFVGRSVGLGSLGELSNYFATNMTGFVLRKLILKPTDTTAWEIEGTYYE